MLVIPCKLADVSDKFQWLRLNGAPCADDRNRDIPLSIFESRRSTVYGRINLIYGVHSSTP